MAGMGWFPTLPADKEAQTPVPPLSSVLLFLTASALEDSASPTLQAGRAQHCQDVGRGRRVWSDSITQGWSTRNAADGTKVSRGSVHSVLGAETRRKEFEQQQWDSTGGQLEWGDISSGQGGTSLVEGEGGRKVMSCSRVTTSAL